MLRLVCEVESHMASDLQLSLAFGSDLSARKHSSLRGQLVIKWKYSRGIVTGFERRKHLVPAAGHICRCLVARAEMELLRKPHYRLRTCSLQSSLPRNIEKIKVWPFPASIFSKPGRTAAVFALLHNKESQQSIRCSIAKIHSKNYEKLRSFACHIL